MSQTSRLYQSVNQSKSLRPTVFWQLAEDIPKPLQTSLMVASIALPLLLWWLITTFGNLDPKFLPSPAKVVEAFGVPCLSSRGSSG